VAWDDRGVADALTDDDYERLLEFRTELRRFLRWSEQEAAGAGITPAQHQLLLAVRGTQHRSGPTIGDVADALLLRHHSAVGLVDRAVTAGLVRRVPDSRDHRVVRLVLTPRGARSLARLTQAHLRELAGLAPRLAGLTDRFEGRFDPARDL
jgi:DNA-binding MarR family transcriptional regulator